MENSVRSRKSVEEAAVKITGDGVTYSTATRFGVRSPTSSVGSVGSNDDERVTRVALDGEVPTEGEDSFGDEDKKSLIPNTEIDKDGVVREYEVALKHLGFGPFHIILLLINGLALSSDSIEVLSISFIFPVLIRADEWGVSNAQEAVLGSVIFIGMLFGSYVWGGLADMIGRRTVLVTSLIVSAIFGFSSAFLPWFWLFVFFRFLSGFGVGGSLPVISPYTSEFIRNKYRGPYLGVQAAFWTVGRVCCAGLAWAIISAERFNIFGYQIHSWRVFIALSALPSLIGAVMYFLLPESPRFLLEIGKHDKAMKGLRQVHAVNNFWKHTEYPVKSIALGCVKINSIGSDLRVWNWKSAGIRLLEISRGYVHLFEKKYLRQTSLMLVVMFCLSFGSYGITLWFPTYVNEITMKSDMEHLRALCNTTTSLSSSSDRLTSYCDCESTATFVDTTINNTQLKEWQIHDALFHDVTFLSVDFDTVLFNNTNFVNCSFQNCTFNGVFFNDTKFSGVKFEYADIEPNSLCFSNMSLGDVALHDIVINNEKIANTTLNASSFLALLEANSNSSCSVGEYNDIVCNSDNFALYRDSFLISASALPGNAASAVAVYFLRRNHWLAMSMFASTVTVFLVYVASSEAFVVAMLCLFTAVTTPSWNDTGLIIAELYPTNIRTTAAGMHLLMARVGSIIGTNIFGLFVRSKPSIPILLVACVLFIGAVAGVLLPKTTRKTLLK